VVNTLRFRACVNGLLRYPMQTGLAVLGLALGVMVFVAVDIATDGAQRAFRLSLSALSGRATYHIVAGARGLPDAVYLQLRRDLGVRQSAPVVETAVRHEKRVLQVLGVDLFAEQAFRSYLATDSLRDGVWQRLLLEPGAVLIGERTASRLGIEPDQHFDVQLNGRNVRLRRVGTLDDATTRGIENVLVADIASVKDLREQPTRLTRIDLILDDADTGLRARIEKILPPDARVEAASARVRSVQELTRAFTLNLTAMSLLAVVIGVFLIYNTLHFTMLRRRATFGTLRALGVTRRELFSVILLEAAMLGLLAVCLGSLAGSYIADMLLALVSRTINDLYFVVSVNEASIGGATLVKAALLGMCGSLLAAGLPASEAVLSPPAHTLLRRPIERKSVTWLLPLAASGAALIGLSILIALTSSSLTGGYVSLAALLVGCSLTVPWLVVVLARGLNRLLTHALLRHTVTGVEAGISRIGVAEAALVVALAATIGVTLMIGSFRTAVEQWLESTLRADIYVRPAHAMSGRDETRIDAAVVDSIRSIPEVNEASMGRFVELRSNGRNVSLFAIELATQSYASFNLLASDAQAWDDFDSRAAVFVSEPYAFHNHVDVGDVLPLPTASGEQNFRVAGIYRDYGSDRGVVMMRMSLYRELWRDDGVSSLGVYLHEPGASQRVMDEIHARTVSMQQLRLRSNRDLRSASLDVFDRTFEITRVLRWLTIIVAVVAILTALSAVQLERRRELALLRSIGLTTRQLAGVMFTQTALLGFFAGLLAIPTGVALSMLLVHVINRRAFGWSMDFVVATAPLGEALVMAILAAVVAGCVPVWRALREVPALALRGE
jgi:putative ABC transport system permease protein